MKGGTTEVGSGGPNGAQGVEACTPAAAPPPPLAARVATVTSLLNTARLGQELELVKQLEGHLTQLKEAQQAERPLAARYQSAVDRATVKRAALKASEEAVLAAEAWLLEAKQVRDQAVTVSEEAEQALELLHQQLGEEAAAQAGRVPEPAPVPPASFGDLVGAVHAMAATTLAGVLPEGAQREMEFALASLSKVNAALRIESDLVDHSGSAEAATGVGGPGGVGAVAPQGGTPPAQRSPSLASQRSCERATGGEPSRKAAKLETAGVVDPGQAAAVAGAAGGLMEVS